MFALTVDGLHAWSIMFAGKTPENRGWRPRNPPAQIAIHAGMRFARDDDPGWENPVYLAARDSATAAQRDWLDVRGAIVGVVDLVGFHDGHMSKECAEHGCFTTGWGRNVKWHWMIAQPRPLTRPLYVRGRQGLWTHPTSEIEKLLAR